MIEKLGTKRIETERLLLRKFTASDADDLYTGWCTDAQVCRFYTWAPHRNIDETKSLLVGWIDQYADPLLFHWAIAHKQSNRAIGAVYLDKIDQDEKSAVISCLLGRLEWGKGYAAESTKAVIRFAFEEAGFETIKAHHHEENTRSGKALLKSGMRYVEQRYAEHPECPRISGNYMFYEINK